jgi:ubiquinol-cytochrome c reductase iron-sulfur subunit
MMDRRPEVAVAVVLGASIVSALVLTGVYLAGGDPQLEGALLFLALGGLGAGLIMWARFLLPPDVISEERSPAASSPEDRAAVQAALGRTGGAVPRRRFLSRMLWGAAAALGLAALFPIRSLGPAPGRSLFRTSWSRGARLVDERGDPIRLDQLIVGSVLTVFPEGRVGSSDAQALLIRVEAGSLRLDAERSAWAPAGNVVYSKLCTHAGCPVGLYRADSQELLCPCHQSSFAVLDGARPTFGPATRPLPQLPVTVDPEGYLVAMGDFPEPVGPAFWDRP